MDHCSLEITFLVFFVNSFMNHDSFGIFFRLRILSFTKLKNHTCLRNLVLGIFKIKEIFKIDTNN